MPMLSLRPARPGDIAAITAIYADEVRHRTASWELEAPDAAEMTRRFETITSGGYPYIVAEDDGVLMGYAYASAYRPRKAYRFTVENSIYVAPAAQGRGVGRALLRALAGRRCRRTGARCGGAHAFALQRLRPSGCRLPFDRLSVDHSPI